MNLFTELKGYSIWGQPTVHKALVYRVNRKTVDICVEACYTVP